MQNLFLFFNSEGDWSCVWSNRGSTHLHTEENREENVALGIGPSGVRGSKELLTLEAFTFTISSAQLTFTNYNYKLMIKRKWPKNKEPFKILKKI